MPVGGGSPVKDLDEWGLVQKQIETLSGIHTGISNFCIRENDVEHS